MIQNPVRGRFLKPPREVPLSILDTDFYSLSWILVTLPLRALGKKDHKFEANLAKHF